MSTVPELVTWLKWKATNRRPPPLDAAARAERRKRRRGFRAPEHYRTDELIEEIRKRRVLWCRTARGFFGPKARAAACEQVANAMNARFPNIRAWDAFEVEFHWRTIFQSHYACITGHGTGEDKRPHNYCCRMEKMAFMNDAIRACSDWRKYFDRN